MMLIRATCFLLALSGVWRVVAQDDVVIRTTTSLVEVRVVAEDKHGKPVADLKKSDFQILDNGRPQAIRLFAAYRGPGTGAAPKTSSDQSDGSSPTPSDYAMILLDWLNTSYGNRIFVQEKVLQLLKDYQPRQRLAVFVLSHDNPRLLCDFTYDRDLLTYMVSRLSLDPEDMLGPSRDESPFGGRGTRGPQTPQADMAHEAALHRASRQTVDTSVALEKIADHMLHVPGRKALLWVTTGIPMVIGGSYYAAFIESAFGRLNKADTAIYTIDSRGLALTPPMDSLYEFADRTGGKIFYNRNDLDACMRIALEDMSVSYTLGFHMPDDTRPGPHALQVRLNRAGIKLRYRESYDPAATIR